MREVRDAALRNRGAHSRVLHRQLVDTTVLSGAGHVLPIGNLRPREHALAGDVERLMYGFSVFHCLPVGLADQPSVGTGTVMRPATLRRYAQEAGFADLEVLPLENPFFTFYRLSG